VRILKKTLYLSLWIINQLCALVKYNLSPHIICLLPL
jgi:hypothetical protein